jgi:hypothetical protein
MVACATSGMEAMGMTGHYHPPNRLRLAIHDGLIISRELALFGADAFLWALRGQWRRLRRMLAAAVEAVLS